MRYPMLARGVPAVDEVLVFIDETTTSRRRKNTTKGFARGYNLIKVNYTVNASTNNETYQGTKGPDTRDETREKSCTVKLRDLGCCSK